MILVKNRLVLVTILLVSLGCAYDFMQRVYIPLAHSDSEWNPNQKLQPVPVVIAAKELEALLRQIVQPQAPSITNIQEDDISAGVQIFGEMQVSLKAIYQLAGKNFALVKIKKGTAEPTLQPYTVNSTIADVTLSEIHAQHIVLEYQSQKIDVTLFKKKNKMAITDTVKE